MRACVFRAPGEPLELITAPDPAPGPGEVVLRVHNCGVCGSDLHAAHSGLGVHNGTIMGHEFAGVITAAGPGATGFRPGDPAVVMSYQSCGECDPCRSGNDMHCATMRMVGFGGIAGGYAELMKARASSVFKIPANLDYRAAATVEPLVVGLHGVRRAALRPGDSCLVMGAGPIGLVTALWARFAGARAIVVSDPVETRRKIALAMGADAAVDPRFQNPLGRLARISGGPPDIVFECAGVAGSLAEAISYARRGGCVVVLGAAMSDDGISPAAAMNKEIEIRFSLGLEPDEVETAIAMLAAGRISTAPMITHDVKLERLPQAFAALPHATGQVKVMIDLT
ncbi:MAG: zinc-dependent alcohol dehydrogenase [Candidatus Binataceae bacterium]